MKKILALLLTLSLLCSVFLPTAADTGTTTQQADALYAAGLFLGTGNGYNLPGKLNRAQGITLALRAQGLENVIQAQSEATVAITLGKLTDVDQVPDWARKYVAYAMLQEPPITRGVSVSPDGRSTFAPNTDMSGIQFITFMVRALGYEATLETAPDVALTSNMLSPTKIVEFGQGGSFTRGQAVEVMYSAIKTGVIKESGKKLVNLLLERGIMTTTAAIGLGYVEPVATPTPTPIANVRLAVDRVEAINTKQLLVTFNKPISEESLRSDYFTVTAGTGSLVPVSPTRSVTDANAIKLTVQGNGYITNFTKVAAKISTSVRDMQGVPLALDAVFTDIPVEYIHIPSLLRVEAIGKRAIRLQFDEPVWDGEDHLIAGNHFSVKIGSENFLVQSAVSDYASNQILLTTASDLKTGLCEVIVNAAGNIPGGVRNFLNLMPNQKTATFVYAPDMSEATAVIESVNRSTGVVTVAFNKPVYGSQIRLFMHVAGIEAYGSDAVSKAEIQASTKWIFTFTLPIPTGTVPFHLVASSGAFTQMTDLYGVRIGNKSMSFDVPVDREAPRVVEVRSNLNTSIDILFDESVDSVEATKTANYKLRMSNGEVVQVSTLQVLLDRQTVRLSASLQDAMTYSLEVSGVKDLSGNVMASSYSGALTIEDLFNPYVVSAVADPYEKKITIQFSEPMNQSEMMDKGNYTIDANGGTDLFASLSSLDQVVVLDSKRVVLQIQSGFTTPSVQMAAIRDLAGKRLGSDTTFTYRGLNDNLVNIQTLSLNLVSASLVDYDKVLLVFNNELTSFHAGDFLFRRRSNGSEPSVPVSITSANINKNELGQYEVLAGLNQKIYPDATVQDTSSRSALEIQILPVGTKAGSNTLISARTHANAIPLVDAMGGTIAKDTFGTPRIQWKDYDLNGKLDTVVIEYEEPIRPDSMSIATYSVQGYIVDRVSVDFDGMVGAGVTGDSHDGSRFVILNISRLNQPLDADQKPVVRQLSPIYDTERNFIE